MQECLLASFTPLKVDVLECTGSAVESLDAEVREACRRLLDATPG